MYNTQLTILLDKLTSLEAKIIELQQLISPVEEKLMNIRECADYTGYEISTIYSMISRKQIPYIKRFKHVVFRKKDIDLWINK